MFWEKFVELCNTKGLSPNNVCAQLGYSTAIATKWKNGSSPRSTTLKKIADYFSVPTNYFFYEGENPTNDGAPSENVIGIIDVEYALIRKYRALDMHGKSLVNSIIDIEYKRCSAGEIYNNEEERLIAAPKITPAEITFDDDETDIT